MQFVMAAAIADRNVGLAQVTDDRVNDPVIRDLMKRVTVRVHPDWVDGKDSQTRPDVVVVKLKNGKEHSHKVALAKGHPLAPLKKEELLAKYRECARIVLKDEAIERSVEVINKLDQLTSLKELMEIMAG